MFARSPEHDEGGGGGCRLVGAAGRFKNQIISYVLETFVLRTLFKSCHTEGTSCFGLQPELFSHLRPQVSAALAALPLYEDGYF